jgi:hypothetical protein
MIAIRRRISTPFAGGRERKAGDDCRARGRSDQRAECPHGRGLPRAIRPQEPEHLAVTDLERDIPEGDAVTEALGQVVDSERSRAALPSGASDPSELKAFTSPIGIDHPGEDSFLIDTTPRRSLRAARNQPLVSRSPWSYSCWS